MTKSRYEQKPSERQARCTSVFHRYRLDRAIEHCSPRCLTSALQSGRIIIRRLLRNILRKSRNEGRAAEAAGPLSQDRSGLYSPMLHGCKRPARRRIMSTSLFGALPPHEACKSVSAPMDPDGPSMMRQKLDMYGRRSPLRIASADPAHLQDDWSGPTDSRLQVPNAAFTAASHASTFLGANEALDILESLKWFMGAHFDVT